MEDKKSIINADKLAHPLIQDELTIFLYSLKFVMYVFLIIVVFLFSTLAFYNTISGKYIVDFVRFNMAGRKQGFSLKELRLLWKLNIITNEKGRAHFFSSIKSLDFCIKSLHKVLEKAQNEKKVQSVTELLTKLYDYRTKFEFELMGEQYHIENTHDIEERQVCLLLSKKVGSIYVRVEEVKDEYIRLLSFDSSAQKASNHTWQNDYAQLYFWRRCDAGYFFVTTVLTGKKIKDGYEMKISHAKDIRRAQKRKSIRANCRFNALLFPLHQMLEYNEVYEKKGGVSCKVKNISEDGAMLYVKGRAKKSVNIKLQLKINNKNVVMCGYIVRFIYDDKSNTSKVHFNAIKVSEAHRNIILSFVYNIIEEQEPNIASALLQEDAQHKEGDDFESSIDTSINNNF